MLLQYRAAAFAGFTTQLFWGFINVMVYQALFRSTHRPQPMRLDQVINYIWLGQAMWAMLAWNADGDVRAMVRNGTVAYELLRPTDLYWLWYARAIAMRLAPTMLRAIPLLIIAALFLGLQPPASPTAASMWVLVMIGALLLGCAVTVLMNISLLWTISGEGTATLLPTVVVLFSGMIIPLPFFPDWMQPILNALPFRGLVDIPCRVYSGHIPPNEAAWMFVHQLAWTVGLILLGRWLLSRNIRRLVVQGG
jgi:ABC-2 type transport system permease protein